MIASSDKSGEILNSRASRGKCETRNRCGGALGTGGFSNFGSIRLRQQFRPRAHGGYVDPEHYAEFGSSPDAPHQRQCGERREGRGRHLECYGRRRVQYSIHELGHVSGPSVGNYRVYGNRHGDSDLR